MSGIDLSTLNDRQRQIVSTLDRPVFVEAGAGSGKTFTLTRRIAWALSPGSGVDGAPFVDDLSQVLVITFTNAAALRSRACRSTRAKAGMREQALMVDSAWISTIHGMCSRILKRHALDLGIDPSFKVAGVNEARALLEQATEEVVGAASRSHADAVLNRAFEEYGYGTLGGPTSFGVVSMVLDVVNAAHSSPDGFDSLVMVGEPDVEGSVNRLRQAVGALGAQSGITPAAREAVMSSLGSLDAFLSAPPGERTPEAASAALAGVKAPNAQQRQSKTCAGQSAP